MDTYCTTRSERWISSPSRRRAYSACSSASSTKSVRADVDTFQPTIRRAYTSITNATYTKPCHVETYVKSDTHSAFGRSAWNCRLTRSRGQGAALSLKVVRIGLPRITPCRPMAFISRSTVQRATAWPSRRSCRQTLRTPYTRKFSSQTRRIASPSSASRCVRVVRRRGDRQHLADRLDPVGPFVLVDERLHGLHRRSSSAWAKYALALRRISLTWRSSRFSRSKALIRSRSSVVGPARKPRSRSACRTQRRNVSRVHPILAPIEPIAAHCELCSPWCSSTICTARSRTSGEYRFSVFMLQSSQRLEPPGKPGRFTCFPHKLVVLRCSSSLGNPGSTSPNGEMVSLMVKLLQTNSYQSLWLIFVAISFTLMPSRLA